MNRVPVEVVAVPEADRRHLHEPRSRRQQPLEVGHIEATGDRLPQSGRASRRRHQPGGDTRRKVEVGHHHLVARIEIDRRGEQVVGLRRAGAECHLLRLHADHPRCHVPTGRQSCEVRAPAVHAVELVAEIGLHGPAHGRRRNALGCRVEVGLICEHGEVAKPRAGRQHRLASPGRAQDRSVMRSPPYAPARPRR